MTLVEPDVELLMSGSQSPGHHRKQCVTEGHRKQSVTEGHRKPSVTEGHRKPYGPYVTIMAYLQLSGTLSCMLWFAFTARSREHEPKQLIRCIFLIYTTLNFEKKFCLYVRQLILRFAYMFAHSKLLVQKYDCHANASMVTRAMLPLDWRKEAYCILARAELLHATQAVAAAAAGILQPRTKHISHNNPTLSTLQMTNEHQT